MKGSGTDMNDGYKGERLKDRVPKPPKPKRKGRPPLWPWLLVLCAGIFVASISGWKTVGSLVGTGNSTLQGMASGAADSEGKAVSPFDPFGNVGGSSGNNSPVAGSGLPATAPDTGFDPGIGAAQEAPSYADAAGNDSFEMAPVPEPEWNTEEYSHIEESGFKSVATEPLSTFAADVDTASYTNVRRMLLDGQAVSPDAVRVEEMVNYFKYDYPEPGSGEAFSVTADIGDCPWNSDHQIMRVGLQAMEPHWNERAPSNLVFLIDVSGSMIDDDKLPLVKRAFNMLTENLTDNDRISIVTYASSDQVMLEGASGRDGVEIREVMDGLFASGGTNGSQGIYTAYELAERYFVPGGNNRVILATDGDLNIGTTSEGDLARLAEEKAESGVALSVLGFGTGNIKDNKMEALADNGDGNYYYIDSDLEARRVLVEEMGGTLNTVAKDVKFQVEFNPANVAAYRLIGYENREMAAQDFADDSKDGGEVGEGHRVTALYELVMRDSPDAGRYDAELKYQTAAAGNVTDLCTVGVRAKRPDGDTSELSEYPVAMAGIGRNDPDLRFASAVAGFGMILRGSEYLNGWDIQDLDAYLASCDTSKDVYRQEFAYLVDRAALIY